MFPRKKTYITILKAFLYKRLMLNNVKSYVKKWKVLVIFGGNHKTYSNSTSLQSQQLKTEYKNNNKNI